MACDATENQQVSRSCAYSFAKLATFGVFILFSIMLFSLQEITEILCGDFLEKVNYDSQLWSTYFNLCALFINQKILQLEQLPKEKRLQIVEKSEQPSLKILCSLLLLVYRYEDMRVLMCLQFANLWTHLGAKDSHLNSRLAEPLLEICLVPENRVRVTAIPLFCHLLEAEFSKSGHVQEV